MRRTAAIVSILIASFVGRSAPADESPVEADLWRVKPAIQIGAHVETGGGVLPGSGFDTREKGGGVGIGLSFVAPARPRLLAGLAFKMTHARVALRTPTASDTQTYNVAAVRAMARAEIWNHPPFDRARHGLGLYALIGAGWNYNVVGTRITYLAGAPAGTAGDLHASHRPALELGGGMQLAQKRDGFLFAEVSWVYNAGPYRLQVFGEPDRRGTYNLSGVSILLGLRFNPPASGEGD